MRATDFASVRPSPTYESHNASRGAMATPLSTQNTRVSRELALDQRQHLGNVLVFVDEDGRSEATQVSDGVRRHRSPLLEIVQPNNGARPPTDEGRTGGGLSAGPRATEGARQAPRLAGVPAPPLPPGGTYGLRKVDHACSTSSEAFARSTRPD